MKLLESQRDIYCCYANKLDPTYKLSAAEEELIANSAPKRRLEFQLGRQAAHQALKKSGMTSSVSLLAGSSGQPMWPSGFIGSISHCSLKSRDLSSLRAMAVVSNNPKLLTLGVDIEYTNRKISSELAQKVCTSNEIKYLADLNQIFPTGLIALICAKEALFKALYPLTNVYFGFRDAELRWDAENFCFYARLQKDLSAIFSCGYQSTIQIELFEQLVLAWLVIPAPTSLNQK